MESRKTRFKRVASDRTNKVLNALRILWNCANKSAYEYTDEDIWKIFKTIEQQVKTMKSKFISKNKKFSL